MNAESVDNILEKLSENSEGQKSDKVKQSDNPEDQKIDDLLKGLLKE